MTAVMISIRPKWCELIASGRKTIEVRKTKPKLDTPFKCYIYCTIARHYVKVSEHMGFATDDLFRNPDTGKIKCDMSCELMCCQNEYDENNFLNGKVLGEFVCDEISTIKRSVCGSFSIVGKDTAETNLLARQSCLDLDDMHRYGGQSKFLYGWHISALQIYDRPRELSEFSFPPERYCKKGLCGGCPKDQVADVNGEYEFDCEWEKPLIHAPMSWCYVEGSYGQV